MSNLKKHLEKIQKEEAAENFAKWARTDAILDDDDEPRVLYSGTLSEFEQFDITKTRPEAYFGQGFYFSDSLADASDNYARREGQIMLYILTMNDTSSTMTSKTSWNLITKMN